LFETMSEGFSLDEIIYDDTGKPYDLRYLMVNPAFERQTGLKAQDIVGRTTLELFPQADAIWFERYGKVALTGEPAHFEAWFGPLERYFEVSAYRTEPGRFAVVSFDITDRKQAERLKDEFIGMVSHELKTPITVIMGAIYTAMSEGITKKEARQLLEDAASSADSLADIVDNLLDLSRAQANRLIMRKEPIDISETARKVALALTKRSEIHHLVVDIPAGLPAVQADQVRVERILHNLVENAIKYSPDGGTITVFAQQRDNHLVVGVKDEGIGISAEDQARLFQPFERLGTTSRVAGVGLGLNVCRQLVEAHSGSIWVESEPGKGATFFFTLPV
jgi:PAS domain S-box-containing protein